MDQHQFESLLPPDATSAFCSTWGVAELYLFGSAVRGQGQPTRAERRTARCADSIG